MQRRLRLRDLWYLPRQVKNADERRLGLGQGRQRNKMLFIFLQSDVWRVLNGSGRDPHNSLWAPWKRRRRRRRPRVSTWAAPDENGLSLSLSLSTQGVGKYLRKEDTKQHTIQWKVQEEGNPFHFYNRLYKVLFKNVALKQVAHSPLTPFISLPVLERYDTIRYDTTKERGTSWNWAGPILTLAQYFSS